MAAFALIPEIPDRRWALTSAGHRVGTLQGDGKGRLVLHMDVALPVEGDADESVSARVAEVLNRVAREFAPGWRERDRAPEAPQAALPAAPERPALPVAPPAPEPVVAPPAPVAQPVEPEVDEPKAQPNPLDEDRQGAMLQHSWLDAILQSTTEQLWYEIEAARSRKVATFGFRYTDGDVADALARLGYDDLADAWEEWVAENGDQHTLDENTADEHVARVRVHLLEQVGQPVPPALRALAEAGAR